MTWHWHREPAESTRGLVRDAAFVPTEKDGLQAALEIVASPGGQVRVTSSSISGAPGRRTIVQASALMFNDMDEAKDAVDLILDRLSDEVQQES